MSRAEGASAQALAARVWSYRLQSEIEAAERFRALAPVLEEFGSSRAIIDMVEAAGDDELRHVSLCEELVRHFGGTVTPSSPSPLRPIAPTELSGADRVLYEVVALSCVTETLSTALLGELVAQARDSACKQAMHSILRDEVNHSRLGWAFLAEQHASGARDCVGAYLPRLLDATLGAGFLQAVDQPDHRRDELAGLGSLRLNERQRIVRETLAQVIFPGFERFGVDTRSARRWLDLSCAMMTH